jgi:uncharacterized protein (TIGR02001 family)
MRFAPPPVPLTLALVMGTATPLTAQAELAGNIGVHSKYLLRGIGLENDNTAVQGGIDYTHESGFYAGWWGSNLGYSYNTNTGRIRTATASRMTSMPVSPVPWAT